MDYSIKKLGLKQGLLNVKLEPVSSNILSVGSSDNFGLFNLEETTGTINYTLKSDIEDGESVNFNLVVDNGETQWTIPIKRIYSTVFETAFVDPADNLNGWAVFGGWDLTDEDFYSAPNSITDSPNNFYSNNQVNEIEMSEPVQLVNASTAYLSFQAKWDIEEDYDYVQVLLSVDGNAPFALCGNYTNEGVDPQPTDEPVYDGTQSDWVLEEIDLSDYLPVEGNVDFTISFRLFSDGFVTGDGFYFDDLKITTVGAAISSTHLIDPSELRVSSRPNPTGEYVYLDIEGELSRTDDYNLLVFNGLGQLIHLGKVKDKGIIKLETSNWLPGVYHFHLTDGSRKTQTGKIVVTK